MTESSSPVSRLKIRPSSAKPTGVGASNVSVPRNVPRPQSARVQLQTPRANDRVGSEGSPRARRVTRPTSGRSNPASPTQKTASGMIYAPQGEPPSHTWGAGFSVRRIRPQSAVERQQAQASTQRVASPPPPREMPVAWKQTHTQTTMGHGGGRPTSAPMSRHSNGYHPGINGHLHHPAAQVHVTVQNLQLAFPSRAKALQHEREARLQANRMKHSQSGGYNSPGVGGSSHLAPWRMYATRLQRQGMIQPPLGHLDGRQQLTVGELEMLQESARQQQQQPIEGRPPTPQVEGDLSEEWSGRRLVSTPEPAEHFPPEQVAGGTGVGVGVGVSHATADVSLRLSFASLPAQGANDDQNDSERDDETHAPVNDSYGLVSPPSARRQPATATHLASPDLHLQSAGKGGPSLSSSPLRNAFPPRMGNGTKFGASHSAQQQQKQQQKLKQKQKQLQQQLQQQQQQMRQGLRPHSTLATGESNASLPGGFSSSSSSSFSTSARVPPHRGAAVTLYVERGSTALQPAPSVGGVTFKQRPLSAPAQRATQQRASRYQLLPQSKGSSQPTSTQLDPSLSHAHSHAHSHSQQQHQPHQQQPQPLHPAGSSLTRREEDASTLAAAGAKRVSMLMEELVQPSISVRLAGYEKFAGLLRQPGIGATMKESLFSTHVLQTLIARFVAIEDGNAPRQSVTAKRPAASINYGKPGDIRGLVSVLAAACDGMPLYRRIFREMGGLPKFVKLVSAPALQHSVMYAAISAFADDDFESQVEFRLLGMIEKLIDTLKSVRGGVVRGGVGKTARPRPLTPKRPNPPHSDPAIQVQVLAASAITSLCGENQENLQCFVDNGGLQALTDMLGASDVRLALAAALALGFCCMQDAHIRNIAASCGVPKMLVALLQQIASPAVLNAIAEIADAHPQCQNGFREAGIIPMLAQLLSPEDSEIYNKTAVTLATICNGNPASMEESGMRGSIPLLTAGLLDHNCANMSAMCLATICDNSKSNQNSATSCIPILVGMLHTENDAIRNLYATSALRSIAEGHQENLNTLRLEGGILRLLDLLMGGVDSVVYGMVLVTLADLTSASDDNAQMVREFMDLNILQRLVKETPEGTKQRACGDALLRLFSAPS
jgi:hypothetical protein